MANRIKDSFEHVHADSAQKESTKQFLSESRKKKRRPFHRLTVQRVLAAACLMLLFTVGAGGYFWIQMPVSYLSIDVNPSIELALNRFNKVVSVTAYNAEGEEVVNGLSLKGKEYTEAIDLVMGSDAMSVYLTGRQDIVFTLAADNSRESELESGVENCSGHMRHGCRHVSADIGVVSEAHDNGLSLGKYNAYLQLLQYDDTVTVEECRNMSISEIERLISECKRNGGHHSGTGHSGYDEMEESGTSSGHGGSHHQRGHRYHGGNHE